MSLDVIAVARTQFSAAFRVKGIEIAPHEDDAKSTDSKAKAETEGHEQEPATRVEISHEARRALAMEKAGLDPLAKIPKNLTEFMAKKTGEFAEKFGGLLKDLNFQLDKPVAFSLDSNGRLRTNETEQGLLDKYAEKKPEAYAAIVKEYKDIAGMQTLKAALLLEKSYTREYNAADTKEKKSAAWNNYLFRSSGVQQMSKILVYKEGEIHSPAVAYAESFLTEGEYKRYKEKGLEAI